MAVTRMEESLRREELRSLGKLAFFILAGTGALVLLSVLLEPREPETVEVVE